ncbi:hypothetical protein [Chlamydia vaughanii]|uniref:hypothetical protein n=1 Tax=Chlamydia vaughanii TaxID=3112552 RepID=UPI0032B1F1E7
MSTLLPTQLSSGTPTLSLNLTQKEMDFTQRRSSFRLFLDTMIIVLGFSTVISIFIAIFFLSGLNMLNATTISLSAVLVLLGILFISIGVLFLINSVDQGMAGIFRTRLAQAEKKIKELQDQLTTASADLIFLASDDNEEIAEEQPSEVEVTIETVTTKSHL